MFGLGRGTAQHALVAGKTGSGKSTLLHALITNLALTYSPEEAELYLVDFKEGVEFQWYATYRLPHARVVAIQSEREFGLSVLQRLDGILRERAADLVTDAFRALALRVTGYRAEVVEFVSPEHTARNLMIRAVRGAPAGDPALVGEYLEMKRFWGVTPYIETALGEAFQSMVQ